MTWLAVLCCAQYDDERNFLCVDYKVICFYMPSLTTGRTWCSPKPHNTGAKQPMNCKIQTKQMWLGEIVGSLTEDSGKNICKGTTFRSEFTYQKIIINAIIFLLVTKEIYRPYQFLFLLPVYCFVYWSISHVEWMCWFCICMDLLPVSRCTPRTLLYFGDTNRTVQEQTSNKAV